MVTLAWPGVPAEPRSRPGLGSRAGSAAAGALGGLLIVRVAFLFDGPPVLAGPVAALAAALIGAALGVWIGARISPFARADHWFLALGLIGGLLLIDPIDPAIIAAAGLAIAWIAARAVRRLRRIAGPGWAAAILAGGLGLTSLGLWWPRLARHVVPGDSGEFQALIPTLGIPHPTGYPAYILIGKALTLLPIGEPAFSLSLLSALLGAIAAALVVLAALELTHDDLAAILAGAVFAWSPVFVAQVVVPEVYALHLAIVAAIVWLAARQRVSAAIGYPAATALLLGLGLAHHRTILLAVPLVVATWFVSARRPRPNRRWALWAGLIALPLLSYLYFVWRWPAVLGRAIDWPEFRALVLADRFQTLIDLGRLLSIDRWRLIATLLAEQLTVVGLGLAVLGLVGWGIRSPKVALPFLSLAALPAGFALVYQVPDVAVFLLPAVLIAALGLAFLPRFVRIWGGRWLAALTRLAIAGILPFLIAAWQPVESTDAVQTEAVAAIAAIDPGPALVVSDVDHFTPLLYAARVIGRRPDLEIVMPDTHQQAYELIEAARAGGRAVYLARHLPRLAETFWIESAGPLTTIRSEPALGSAPDTARAVAPGVWVTAGGAPDQIRRGEDFAIDLEWWVERAPREAWRPVLAIADAAGTVRAAAVARDPVGGQFPFPLWRDRQKVRDHHRLTVPDDLPSGDYAVWLLLLRPDERPPERISDYLPGGEPIARPRIEPATAPIRPVVGPQPRVGDDLWLIEVHLPAQVEAGQGAEARLTWRALRATGPRLVRLALDGGTRTVTAAPLPPLAAGETLVTPVPLPAVGVGNWPIILSVSVDGEPVGIRSDWYQPSATEAELGRLRVAPAQPTAPTFDNRIRLEAADLPTGPIAGDTLTIAPRWRATARPRADYTVFVHLVDAEGRVRAQADGRPRQGTLPTDQWPLDTVIDDRYQVPIRDRLPPGTYRVVIGFYDARSMIRLPITDARGRPAGDHAVLGEVTIERAAGS